MERPTRQQLRRQINDMIFDFDDESQNRMTPDLNQTAPSPRKERSVSPYFFQKIKAQQSVTRSPLKSYYENKQASPMVSTSRSSNIQSDRESLRQVKDAEIQKLRTENQKLQEKVSAIYTQDYTNIFKTYENTIEELKSQLQSSKEENERLVGVLNSENSSKAVSEMRRQVKVLLAQNSRLDDELWKAKQEDRENTTPNDYLKEIYSLRNEIYELRNNN